MAPTEILAKQHFNLAKKYLNHTDVSIEILTGKVGLKEKKIIKEKI